MFTKLKIDTTGLVARLELCSPGDDNAFDEAMHGEFAKALGLLRLEQDIRVILLSAQGRSFSAGGDLDYIRRLTSDPVLRARTYREGYDIFSYLHDLPVPVVAAVQGHAVGVAATIVTSADIVVAWKDAKIGDPHVRIGLAAGDGGVLSWSAAAGIMRAKRMLLTGQAITAEEAARYGLVTDLVDTPEEALPKATELAERIAALPPIAVQGTKRAFNALGKRRIADAFEVSLLSETISIMSDDAAEAVTAAIEKRPGIYRNR